MMATACENGPDRIRLTPRSGVGGHTTSPAFQGKMTMTDDKYEAFLARSRLFVICHPEYLRRLMSIL